MQCPGIWQKEVHTLSGRTHFNEGLNDSPGKITKNIGHITSQ